MRLNGLWLVVLVALVFAGCSRSAQEYLDSGNKYFDEGKYREATVEYRNALQQEPRHGEARRRLAEAYLKVGDVQNGFREYVRAADVLTTDKDVQIKAGMLLLLAGDFDAAKARAEKVLSLDPRNVDAHLLLGNATAGLKDLDGAIREVEEAVSLAPGEGRTHTSLGVLHLAKGDAGAAESSFKKAIEIEPRSVVAHLALANFYWANGRTADAESSFRRALAIEPANVQAHRALAGFYIGTQRVPEAEPHLKAVVEATRSVEASLALADYYVVSKRPGEALKLLQAVAGQTGAFAEANARIAAVQFGEGQRTRAHQTIDSVLAKEPNNPRARLVKAQFLLEESKVDEAMTEVKAAVAADGRNVQAQYMLGRILASRSQVDAAIEAFTEVVKLNPRATAAQIELARLQLAKGATDPAVQFAQQAVASEPGNAVARLVLARSLMARGDLSRADTEMKRLLEAYPEAAPVQSQAGTLRLLQKDAVNARKSFEKALTLDPNSLEALGGLATLDVAAGRVSEARANVEARVARTPNDPGALLLASRVYGASGDPAKAEQLLLKTLEVAPGNLEAYGVLGQLYVSQRKLDQARQKFEELASRQAKPVAAETMVGMILQMQGREAEAQKRYERVIEMDPRAQVAANNLAWMYAEGGGNLDVALQLAQVAKAGLPDVAEVNDTLGWVYYKKDMARMALAPLQEAVDRAPRNPIYHYHLGLAAAKAGDAARARAAFQAALQLNANFPEADQVRRALAGLEAEQQAPK